MDIDDIKKQIEKLRAKNKDLAQKQNILFEYQNNGMKLEKLGNIDAAINSYKQAIEYAKITPEIRINNYYYSIERLVVLFRRKKDYTNEIDIIRYALSNNINEKDRSDMSARLEKAEKKLIIQNIPN